MQTVITLLITFTLIGTTMPIAFALGLSALLVLLLFDGFFSLQFLPNILFGGLTDFGLIAIPMFIVMGTIIASTKASSDLYESLHQWLYRVPGGLLISTIFASMIFAALSGSSPATSAAVGKIAIPETKKRGYPAPLSAGTVAAGGTLGILIPPSVTMIVYGVAAETSIGRLFIAGIIPGLMMVALFSLWIVVRIRWLGVAKDIKSERVPIRERLRFLPRVLPFMSIIVLILWALYGGVATPSEAAGVAAFAAFVFAVVLYRIWQPRAISRILSEGVRESVMLMLIIGTSALFAYALSSLYITQAAAESIIAMNLSPVMLMVLINIFLLIAGFFLPPVSVIVMAIPILLPIIDAAGFNRIWFGVLMTLNMEIGLITPPVGLNLYVLKGIAPDLSFGAIVRGSYPFMLLLILGMALLYAFPGLATWLPTALMGS